MEAGAPAIRGTYDRCPYEERNYYAPSGALYACGSSMEVGGVTSFTNNLGFGIDASRSSSIYGASTTITPLSLKTTWFIKY